MSEEVYEFDFFKAMQLLKKGKEVKSCQGNECGKYFGRAYRLFEGKIQWRFGDKDDWYNSPCLDKHDFNGAWILI